MLQLAQLEQQDFAEEMRLAYVAMTRAREHLYLLSLRSLFQFGRQEELDPADFFEVLRKRRDICQVGKLSEVQHEQSSTVKPSSQPDSVKDSWIRAPSPVILMQLSLQGRPAGSGGLLGLGQLQGVLCKRVIAA